MFNAKLLKGQQAIVYVRYMFKSCLCIHVDQSLPSHIEDQEESCFYVFCSYDDVLFSLCVVFVVCSFCCLGAFGGGVISLRKKTEEKEQ